METTTTTKTETIPVDHHAVGYAIDNAEDIGALARRERETVSWAPRSTRSQAAPLTEALYEAAKAGKPKRVAKAYAAWDAERRRLAAKVAAARLVDALDEISEWAADSGDSDRPESSDEAGSSGFEIDWEAMTVTGWAVCHNYGDFVEVVETEPRQLLS